VIWQWRQEGAGTERLQYVARVGMSQKRPVQMVVYRPDIPPGSG
jgi:hypothetical protein